MLDKNVIDPKDTKTSGREYQEVESVEYRKKLEKLYEKKLPLQSLSTFIILILAIVLPSFLVFNAFSFAESDTFKIIAAVIGGLVAMLSSVRASKFFQERERRHRIKELRASEKEFFDRIRRDSTSRIAEKVR